MDIETIRARIRAKHYLVYDHAVTEAFKDGLSLRDILHALLAGEIIEEYPERHRCLVYGNSATEMPIHVAVDYARVEIEIVTAYVPDNREWIHSKIRKRRIRR